MASRIEFGGRSWTISGPVLVFLCGVALLPIAAFVVIGLRPSNAPHAPPSASNPDQPIAALTAEFTRSGGGGVISARLSPLHVDAGRQEFERNSMRERLGLPAGEPWRLSLRLESDGSDAAPLALGAVEVRDEQGVALRSIPSAEGSQQLADPLRALFVPPAGELQPGQAVDWVLWGRRPGDRAQLAGLSGVELRFEARTVRRSELSLPLARLDRTTAKGKNDAADASEDGHGDPPDEQH